MNELYLASTSPRRAQLLEQIGVAFTPLAVAVDESIQRGETPAHYVQRLARAKALAGLEKCSANEGCVVLGGDTAVVCDGQIFGKPAGRDEAMAMLAALSGKVHRVYSAVCLANASGQETRLVVTKVRFRPLSRDERQAYWDTGEPQGKAGAYAIQGFGAALVAGIEGSYSAVVGLPLAETSALLETFGVPVWSAQYR